MATHPVVRPLSVDIGFSPDNHGRTQYTRRRSHLGSRSTLSAAGQDARRPRIASSPDGSHSLVVYINEIDDDPYYTMSTNQGQSWSPPSGTKLHATAGTSAQVIGVIDRNDKAFAIWVEKNVALGTNLYSLQKRGW